MRMLTKPRLILVLIAVFAFLGFLDATYLTIKHYQGVLPPCSVSGCENVLTSRYATVGTLPISLLGSVYYLLVMGLSILKALNPKFEIRILVLLIFSGFFVSVILFLIQALIIHSFCQYCLFSEAVSILLIFSIILLRLYKGTGYRE